MGVGPAEQRVIQFDHVVAGRRRIEIFDYGQPKAGLEDERVSNVGIARLK